MCRIRLSPPLDPSGFFKHIHEAWPLTVVDYPIKKNHAYVSLQKGHGYRILIEYVRISSLLNLAFHPRLAINLGLGPLQSLPSS